jgi:hypothetical protein
MGTSKKKVDTWYFSVDDVMENQIMARKQALAEAEDDSDAEVPTGETYRSMEERKIAIELYLEKETDEGKLPPHPLEKVSFTASCHEREKYGLYFDVTGTDIAALRALVWNLMDERFEIKWHDYFKVYLTASSVYTGVGEGLVFSYDTVWKGITWEGKELLKEWSHSRNEHYKISPWPGKFTDRNGIAIACIPRNDVTEAALEEFRGKIATMRNILKTYMTPENIMATLTGMSGLKLLEASTEQLSAEETDKYERTKTGPDQS